MTAFSYIQDADIINVKVFIMRTSHMKFRFYLSTFILCIALLPATVFALTPIARYDVVPYQRISHGTTFKFGVVAFSKARISNVTFSISGQGYSGGTKTASSMTYNDRTNVYEYWVPISSSEFTSNGPITVNAVVTGRDGGSQNLGSLYLNVDATGALPEVKAWVSKSGSDSTGKINNESQPFSSIYGAINAAQAANSGSADGAIIYLSDGSYSAGYDGTTSTNNEWITITRASGASKSSTVLNSAGSLLNTKLLKVSGLTIRGSNAISTKTAKLLWLDNNEIVGNGRQYTSSNPVQNRNRWDAYWTGNHIYNSDFGIVAGIMSRNNNIEKISNDSHVNTYMIINARVDDVDPQYQYPGNNPHADVYQIHTTGWASGDWVRNIIVYGMYATNCNYQGFFLRPADGTGSTSGHNIAIVNNFVELRDSRKGPDGMSGGFSALQGVYDHLVIWQNTFVNKPFAVYKDTTTQAFKFTNVSIVGNYFYAFQDAYSNGTAFDAGNNNNNEALNNHYYRSYDDGYGSDNRLHSPDTASPPSHTAGTLELDLKDTTNYVNFGYPTSLSSVLVNRISNEVVPSDAHNADRGAAADIGAFERNTSGTTPASNPPSPPTLF
jgi:hypothetical protein